MDDFKFGIKKTNLIAIKNRSNLDLPEKHLSTFSNLTSTESFNMYSIFR
jgi:hypothetical protein